MRSFHWPDGIGTWEVISVLLVVFILFGHHLPRILLGIARSFFRRNWPPGFQ
jgi:hypothetical protein